MTRPRLDPAEGTAAHLPAKAGIDKFTEVTALEAGRHGIRINSVAPARPRECPRVLIRSGAAHCKFSPIALFGTAGVPLGHAVGRERRGMGEGRTSELRLRVLEAVTEGTLRNLDLHELFEILLWRVRELFAVDTVTVLLVDASGRQLVATAASGLKEEVFQGVRVAVGTGFAGRVAQHREPVQIERVDESTVVNPLLWERGLQVLLGAPMVAESDLVGVIHVGSTVPRRFTDEEVGLLQLVADRLATAAHMHRARSERAAAAMLQDSLLPGRLPSTDGWELAARYVPGAGNGVGGDWYDVFDLPGRRIGVVIGDVVGGGLAAAVVMGRLRSALRAYALEFCDPAEVLGKLDRKASHFEANTMATVGYAVIDTAAQRMDLSLAGHLPPVIAAPGQVTRFVDAPVDPPIGYDLAVTGRRGISFDVPAGALIALYTDGLVERRRMDLDERLEILRNVVSPMPPEAACVRIMAALVGDQPAADDIAVVTIRHSPARDMDRPSG